MTQTSPSPALKPQAKNRIPSGFRVASIVKESHQKPIYSLVWSADIFHGEIKPSDDPDKGSGSSTETENSKKPEGWGEADANSRRFRYLATCGGNQVSVYEVELRDGKRMPVNRDFVIRQAYVDADEEEEFYACAYGGRCLGQPFGYKPMRVEDGLTILLEADTESHVSIEPQAGMKRSRDDAILAASSPGRKQLFQTMTEMESFDGPQLLCAAGRSRTIKVIDTVRRLLFFTLSGHEDDIYDLKFSPTDEWLLLSASKDESVRLWNVKNSTCVAIFAGHEGHRESVLTVAWHPLGAAFASGGMDTTVKLWNVDTNTDVFRTIQESQSVRPRLWDSSGNSARAQPFRTIFEQIPIFSTNKVHLNYVDSLEFVGDMILSKSIDNEVVLWKPVGEKSALSTDEKSPQHHRLPSEATVLRTFKMQSCQAWFTRFHTSEDATMLACGNDIGDVRVWSIDAKPKKNNFTKLTNHNCTRSVRMVAFSPDSDCLVACCDDASVWKWDAVY